jgi:hypothetical protein
MPFQALQIIFEMQGQGTNQKNIVKKIRFYKLQNVFFSFLFILIPPTFKHHNFNIFY